MTTVQTTTQHPTTGILLNAPNVFTQRQISMPLSLSNQSITSISSSSSSSSSSNVPSPPSSSNPPSRSSSSAQSLSLQSRSYSAPGVLRVRFAPLPDPRRLHSSVASPTSKVFPKDPSPMSLPPPPLPSLEPQQVSQPLSTIQPQTDSPANPGPPIGIPLTRTSTGSRTPWSGKKFFLQLRRGSTLSSDPPDLSMEEPLLGGIKLFRVGSKEKEERNPKNPSTASPEIRLPRPQPPALSMPAPKPLKSAGRPLLNGRVYGSKGTAASAKLGANPFASARDDEPEFVEWGYGGMGSLKNGGGGVWSAVQSNGSVMGMSPENEDDDDGSGMGWVKKRRREKEAREKEKLELEMREQQTQQQTQQQQQQQQQQQPPESSIPQQIEQDEQPPSAPDLSEHEIVTTSIPAPVAHHHHHHHRHGHRRTPSETKSADAHTPTPTHDASAPLSTPVPLSPKGGDAPFAPTAPESETSQSDSESEDSDSDDEEGEEEKDVDDAPANTRITVCAGVEKISRHKH